MLAATNLFIHYPKFGTTTFLVPVATQPTTVTMTTTPAVVSTVTERSAAALRTVQTSGHMTAVPTAVLRSTENKLTAVPYTTMHASVSMDTLDTIPMTIQQTTTMMTDRLSALPALPTATTVIPTTTVGTSSPKSSVPSTTSMFSAVTRQPPHTTASRTTASAVLPNTTTKTPTTFPATTQPTTETSTTRPASTKALSTEKPGKSSI